MVSTCTEGRTTIYEDENCVTVVVHWLMKVSPAVTDHGIRVIWSSCYMSRDRMAQESAMRNNGLTKVLLVMQSNCSDTVRQIGASLIIATKNKASQIWFVVLDCKCVDSLMPIPINRLFL
ncbi:unnamed protein product [Lactuca virosa]|uniref:U-box domain-containing protein n=1 Tax=Lactuca virosa TaxID=75947 RepID=A0AAU9N1T5_9ASTR|nr:unnamed protein product [Lactuca virosa]